VLAFPVAIAAGVALADRKRVAVGVVCACALWALGSTLTVVPASCHVRTLELSEIEKLRVDRCTFRWMAPRPH